MIKIFLFWKWTNPMRLKQLVNIFDNEKFSTNMFVK